MASRMLLSREKFEILYPIIRAVPVDVVNVEAIWDRTMGVKPDFAVDQDDSALVGNWVSIIASG